MGNLIWITDIVFVVWFVANKKGKVSEVNQQGLTVDEKIIVWITCILAPIINGLIFYYGWKKTLPIKAKQANRISWIAFVLSAIIGFLFLMNSSPNFIGYLTNQPNSNTQVTEVAKAYQLKSSQDDSTWVLYTSPDGYSFKYPATDIVANNFPIPNSISTKISPNQSFLTFKASTLRGGNLTDLAKTFTYIGTGQMEIQDITVGNIAGKVITSSSTETFIFSIANDNFLIFVVPLNISPNISHSIIFTLTLVK